jgi:hypothetical protein
MSFVKITLDISATGFSITKHRRNPTEMIAMPLFVWWMRDR